MNRNLRRWICSLLMGMAVSATPYYIIDSFAATAKIAFSDPTATVGSEVSVTMKFTCTSGEVLGNTDVMLSYDANLLEFKNDTENASGGAGAIRVWSGVDGTSEIVTTLRFKALQAGTTAIKVSSWEGYDNDGQTLTMEKEGSSTIKVAGLQTSSTDASLQSLQISPGTLTPGFTPGVESYTATVGMDTQRLTVSAKANNEKATVTVEGGAELQDGENTVTCKVTAEDGTTVKNYTILVSRVEGGGQTETGESDGAVDETSATEPPVLAELDSTAKKIRIIALPEGTEIPTGFKESLIAIGETKVQGWTWAAEETPRYCVFYGMNENGEQDFYRYDLTEKTIQRYFPDPAGEGAITAEDYLKVANDYNSLLDDFKFRKWILIGLGALSAILAVCLGVVCLGRGKKNPPYDSGDRPKEIPVTRTTRKKRLSKEERYMMGEEELEPVEDYLPEVVEAVHPEQSFVKEPIGDVEAILSVNLAKEAAAVAEEALDKELSKDDDGDDFEFFDLEDK